MKSRLIALLQLFVVLLFIIFETFIWEGIAKPIYEKIHALKILKKIEAKVKNIDPLVVLLLFVVLLTGVEMLGIFAGILFVKGYFFLGMGLYLTKIPIAAFTFWLFRIAEDKLMHFEWFKWLYFQIKRLTNWFKELIVYQETIEKFTLFKHKIRKMIGHLKRLYFTQEGQVAKRLRRYYRKVKAYMRKSS